MYSRSVSSNRLRRLRLSQAAVGIVGYAVFASIPEDEVFPFFDWDLFSVVPHAEETDYGLRVIEVDGEPLPQPLFLEETDGLFPLSRSPTANEIVQALGAAVRRGDDSETARALALLKTVVLEPHEVTFEMVLRDYDIVERARSRRFIRIDRLTIFEAP